MKKKMFSKRLSIMLAFVIALGMISFSPPQVAKANTQITIGNSIFDIDVNGNATLYSSTSTGSITVQSIITSGGKDYPVVRIGTGNLVGKFQSITIPTSVTKIEDNAFNYSTSNIIKLIIFNGRYITSLGNNIFDSNTNISLIGKIGPVVLNEARKNNLGAKSVNYRSVSYTVKLDATTNGGSLAAGVTVDNSILDTSTTLGSTSYPGDAIPPQGSFFLGWFDSAVGGKQVTFPIANPKDYVTYYAQYYDKVIFHFNGNGDGTDVFNSTKSSSYEYDLPIGTALTKPSPPNNASDWTDKDGNVHLFTGWKTDNSNDVTGVKDYVFGKTVPAGITDIYASWANFINYYGDGGTMSGVLASGYSYNAPPVKDEGTYGNIYDPTPPPGLTFLGWFDKKTDGNQWFGSLSNPDLNPAPTLIKNEDLYAHYGVVARFDPGIGSLTVGSNSYTNAQPYTEGVVKGNKILYPGDPTPPNKVSFLGWNDGTGTLLKLSDFANYVLNDDVTFTAVYSKKFDLTYNIGKGSSTYATVDGTNTSTKVQVNAGNNGVVPSGAPNWIGHDFIGWSDTGSVPTVDPTMVAVSGDATYQALWLPASVGIQNFDGSGNGIQATINDDGSVVKPTTPAIGDVSNGMMFEGYFKDLSFTTPFDFSATAIDDSSIYSKWGYGVTFNVGTGDKNYATVDGLNATITEPLDIGDPVKVPTPFWAGHIFTGWNPSTIESPMSGQSAIYSATWRDNKVTLVNTTPSGTSLQGTINPNGSVLLPVTPKIGDIVDGKTFRGWFIDNNYNTTFDFTKTAVDGSSVYGEWTDASLVYNGTFYMNAVDTTTVYIIENAQKDGTILQPADPSRIGCLFDGWYTDSVGGTQYSFPLLLKGNISLYAHWTLIDNGGGNGGGGNGGGSGVKIIDQVPVPLGTVSIEWIPYLFGYLQSNGSYTVKPEASITRGEVASALYHLSQQAKANPVLNGSFTDVDSKAWYSKYVNTLASEGIISGYKDGTFRPNQPITRAEFATLVAKFTKVSLGTKAKDFSDVSSDFWAYNYINKVSSNGYISGYPKGTFKPMKNITRAEVASIMNKVTGRKMSLVISQAPDYKDLSKTYWAYDDIIMASMNKDNANK